MAVVEVTIVPIGTGTPSVSRYVAACHKVLHEAKNVKHRLTPMSTIIEGNLEQIMPVVLKMHETVFTFGSERVSTLIRIDDRRDKEVTMDGKIRAVEEKL